MHRVFVSYTSHDRATADLVCAVLERHGIECWIAPRNVPPGFPWAETIVEAISRSEVVLALISRDAYRSDPMAHEMERADSDRIPILPVRLDAAPLEGQFKYFLGNKQWLALDAQPSGGWEPRLVAAIQGLRAQSVPAREGASEAAPPSGDSRPGVRGLATRNGVAAAILGEANAALQTVWDVATRREAALASMDVDDPGTRRFAIRFLGYLSLVSLLLHVPAWSASGVGYLHPGFLLPVFAEDLVDALSLCILLGVGIRMFGGRAEPGRFFAVFAFLSVFRVLGAACLIPVYARSISVQAVDLETAIAQATASANRISNADLMVLLLGYALWATVNITFVASLFRAFHIRQQLGWLRTSASGVVGIAMWSAVTLVLSQPWLASLYETYRHH